MPYGWLFTLHICSDVAILLTSLTCPQSPLLDSFLPTFNFFSSLITVQHTDLLERCWGSSPLEARLYQTGDLCLCGCLSLLRQFQGHCSHSGRSSSLLVEDSIEAHCSCFTHSISLFLPIWLSGLLFTLLLYCICYVYMYTLSSIFLGLSVWCQSIPWVCQRQPNWKFCSRALWMVNFPTVAED